MLPAATPVAAVGRPARSLDRPGAASGSAPGLSRPGGATRPAAPAASPVATPDGRARPARSPDRPPAPTHLPLRSATICPPRRTVRRITPTKQRNFGRIHDVFPVPDLTEIQTRSYERFLQADIAGRGARRLGPGRGLPRDLPDRELRQDAEAGIHQVRPGQAALRARRVPPAPPDLRPPAPRLAPPEQGRDGDRGVGLPRRHADHDRRRRVHHQRRRARRRQPAPPHPRASTSSSRSRPATRKLHACRIIPERGSWIELQVTKKDTLGVRIDQSGKFSSMTLLRAMSPQFSSDEAILQAFYETEDDRHRRPQGRRQARRPDRLRRRRRPEHRRGPDRERHDHLQDLGAGPGRRQARRRSASSRTPRTRSSSSRSRKTRPPTTRAPCCGSTSGSGRATRRSWRRPASCSTRSSSTPTATASARSAGSGSTASSTRRSPRTR